MNAIIRVFTKCVGLAALTAAGMIGAGAVATRLLAGAWFGFDLLWVAILVIPMVIVTLDSAAPIGILSGGRGLLDMVRTDIGAWLAWVVSSHGAGERHRQHEPDVGDGGGCVRRDGHAAAGWRRGDGRPRSRDRRLTGSTVVAAVLGGYKRMEVTMPALLKAIFAMVGNLAMAPLSVPLIIYFVSRPSLGEFRANSGRNAVRAVTFLFALGLVVNGLR